MLCCLCGSDLEESTATHFSELKNQIMIIKQVPCHKCKQCGETYFNFTVARRLEQITEQLKNALVEVAIVNYSAA